MKQIIILVISLFSLSLTSKAQTCDVQIKVLEGRYMFGVAKEISSQNPVKKISVEFTNEYMEVIIPLEGKNYQIQVDNEACQAYCSRAKRIRQLHSGDEKLVKNLFKSKQKELLAQLQQCSI